MSLIALQGGATGTGTVTLLAPVTNTNRTINLPDSNGTIVTSATAGVPINGPAFSAYLSANQSIANSTNTKVQCNTEEFDTNSNYDNATNFRFTPTIAGYYQVSAFATMSAATTTGQSNIALYKNGSQFKNGAQVSNGTSGFGMPLSTLISMNGSTDYLEIYVFQNTGSSQNLNGNVSSTYFQAALIRSAV